VKLGQDVNRGGTMLPGLSIIPRQYWMFPRWIRRLRPWILAVVILAMVALMVMLFSSYPWSTLFPWPNGVGHH